MIYEKEKIRRLIEHKDEITQSQIKNDLEWIIECYNEYFANSREYDYQRKEYKKILNKYYNSEDEKASIKEELILVKNKYRALKDSCKNLKTMI